MMTSALRQRPHATSDGALEFGENDASWTQGNSTPYASTSAPTPFRFSIKEYYKHGYAVPPESDRRVIEVEADDDLDVVIDLDLVPHFTSAIQEKLADENVEKTRPDGGGGSDMWDPGEGYRPLKLINGGNFDHGGFLASGTGGFSVFSLNVMPGVISCARHGQAVMDFARKLGGIGTDQQWAWLLDEMDVFHVGTHFTPEKNKTYNGQQARQHFHLMSSRDFTDQEIGAIERVVYRRHMMGCGTAAKL